MPQSIRELRTFKSAYAKGHGMKIELSTNLTLNEAGPMWLASRRGLSEGSVRDYEKNILRLQEFFRQTPLREINIERIAAYQEHRQRKAGPSRINHETMTLSQVLQRAKLWKPLAEYFEPLPMPKKRRGRALTDEEEKRLFAIAASKPKCQIGFAVWTITANTSAHWSEITNLRLRNLVLDAKPDVPFGAICIQDGIKNEYRERNIPLNTTARTAIDFLVKRAKRCGATNPDHYLIPDRFGNPDKPMTSCKTAWNSIRKELAKDFPHLERLRQYDLRHHSITRLLENPEVSEATAESIAGHISHEMKRLYSHPRMKAKVAAVMAMDRKAYSVQA